MVINDVSDFYSSCEKTQGTAALRFDHENYYINLSNIIPNSHGNSQILLLPNSVSFAFGTYYLVLLLVYLYFISPTSY